MQGEDLLNSMWESEAMKYCNASLNKQQQTVVNAGESYYRAIKKHISWFTNDFPKKLTSKAMTLAWIMKAGDNQEEVNQLFPDQICRLNDLREVVREPNKIRTQIAGSSFINTQPANNGYYPVLVVLHYLLMCESWQCDRLLRVKNSEKNREIKAETSLYRIYIIYKDAEPFNIISIFPKREEWSMVK